MGKIERDFRTECTAALRDVAAQRGAVECGASDTATKLHNATRAIDAMLPQWARFKQDAAQCARASDARHSALLERRAGVVALWRELAISPDQQRAKLRAEFDAARRAPAQRGANVLAALSAEARALRAEAALVPAVAKRESVAARLSALKKRGAEGGAQAPTKEALDTIAVAVWEANNELGSLDAALRDEIEAYRVAHGRAPRCGGVAFAAASRTDGSHAPLAGPALEPSGGAAPAGASAGGRASTAL